MKQKDTLFLLISVAVLVFAWIIFNIIHSTLTSTISVNLTQQILPISAVFDTNAIKNMKLRIKVNPLYDGSSESASLTQSTPTPTIPIATDSPTSSTGGASQ
ncbi:MAG: hypothetical protein ACREGI_02925 [Candidatus Levyibacteriota bacterium]